MPFGMLRSELLLLCLCFGTVGGAPSHEAGTQLVQSLESGESRPPLSKLTRGGGGEGEETLFSESVGQERDAP